MHLKRGLTVEEAGRICSHECRAMCCRGPLYLQLTASEVAGFRRNAERLGVALHLVDVHEGGAAVRFLDHAGEHCPMLDDATSTCRIYAERPSRCREFPNRPRPECAISGG